MDKKSFWNGWDFKTIFQIVVTLLAIIISYVRLEERVESNRLVAETERGYIKDMLMFNKNIFDARFNEIKTDLAELRKYVIYKNTKE